jgi:hypothetical protein
VLDGVKISAALLVQIWVFVTQLHDAPVLPMSTNTMASAVCSIMAATHSHARARRRKGAGAPGDAPHSVARSGAILPPR